MNWIESLWVQIEPLWVYNWVVKLDQLCRIKSYEAECLSSYWMYDYIPLSISLHTVQNLGWIFAVAMHAKVK